MRGIGQNKDMFRSDDDIVPGVRNLSKQKLEANTCFMVQSIIILAASVGADPAVTPTDDTIVSALMASVDAFPTLTNSSYRFQADGKTLLKDIPTSRHQIGQYQVAEGEYKLGSPFLLLPNWSIEFAFALRGALANNVGVKIELRGLRAVPISWLV